MNNLVADGKTLFIDHEGVLSVRSGKVSMGVAGLQLSNLTGLTGNPPSTLVYTVPPGKAGLYLITVGITILQAASTSSTTSTAVLTFSNGEDGGLPSSVTAIGNRPDNLTGFSGGNQQVRFLTDGATITFSGTGYTSVGTTSLVYSYRIHVLFLGADAVSF
jgi:hypothetical protein